jgi:hypothetical protein
MASRSFAVVGVVAAAALVAGVAQAAAAPSATDGRAVVARTHQATARAAVDETPSTFVPVSPTRVLDTRENGAPVGPGGLVNVDLNALTPSNATAVVLNVTGTQPTASTYVTVYPAGEARPTASNLNLVAGQTRANQVTVALNSADRRISLFNFQGATHLVADLSGYYVGNTASSRYTTVTPYRALDTRGNGGPVGPGGTRTVDLSTTLPAGATAVTFNLTAVEATTGTFVTAYPAGQSRPLASNVNVNPGENVPNQVTVQLGTNRSVTLYNGFGNVQLIADVAGYYAPGVGNVLIPFSPERWLDTRDPEQAPGLDPSYFLGLIVGTPDIKGVVANLTGAGPTAPQFITVWPGGAGRPFTSNLNLVTGQVAANAVNVGVAFEPNPNINNYAIDFANNNGYVEVIFDVSGIFVAP